MEETFDEPRKINLNNLLKIEFRTPSQYIRSQKKIYNAQQATSFPRHQNIEEKNFTQRLR